MAQLRLVVRRGPARHPGHRRPGAVHGLRAVRGRPLAAVRRARRRLRGPADPRPPPLAALGAARVLARHAVRLRRRRGGGGVDAPARGTAPRPARRLGAHRHHPGGAHLPTRGRAPSHRRGRAPPQPAVAAGAAAVRHLRRSLRARGGGVVRARPGGVRALRRGDRRRGGTRTASPPCTTCGSTAVGTSTRSSPSARPCAGPPRSARWRLSSRSPTRACGRPC